MLGKSKVGVSPPPVKGTGGGSCNSPFSQKESLMRASSDGSGSSSYSPQKAKRRIGLTQYAEIQLKEKLRKRSPSEPWVEAQIKTNIDVTADGQPIVYRYHDPRVFPPGGEETLMVRCPRCGVFTPP